YAAAYTPESGILQYRLANVYFMRGAYEAALIHYHQAITLVPTSQKWYPAILRSYLMLNKLETALAFIKPPMGYNIQIGLSKEDLYYIEGWIYQKQGLLDKARDRLTHVLSINPELKKVHNLLLKVNANTLDNRLPKFPYYK
ncbi:MAG: tetratricopeptide repeat protein, partial [Thiomargarita sp.]|nr:tetratricopeptide repeat protein [Thiomargarita sp.]